MLLQLQAACTDNDNDACLRLFYEWLVNNNSEAYAFVWEKYHRIFILWVENNLNYQALSQLDSSVQALDIVQDSLIKVQNATLFRPSENRFTYAQFTERFSDMNRIMGYIQRSCKNHINDLLGKGGKDRPQIAPISFDAEGAPEVPYEDEDAFFTTDKLIDKRLGELLPDDEVKLVYQIFVKNPDNPPLVRGKALTDLRIKYQKLLSKDPILCQLFGIDPPPPPQKRGPKPKKNLT
jgi:hypothetical protein